MTFTLTGTLKDHAGRPKQRVSIRFVPNPPYTVDQAGDTIYIGEVLVQTDASGRFSVELHSAANLYYKVVSKELPDASFAALADGETTDLADVTPIASVPEPPVLPIHFTADRGVVIFTTSG